MLMDLFAFEEIVVHVFVGYGLCGGGRAGVGHAQATQGFQFLVNGFGEDEWVEGGSEKLIGTEVRPLTPVTPLEAVEGRFGRVIAAVDCGADMDFGEELEGRLKEVLIVEEFFGIEIVEGVTGLQGFPAVPAEEGADVGKVLLFDMRVVVFLVGARAGELERVGAAEAKEVVVDEFFAVIGVDSLEPERKAGLKGLEGFDDSELAFA
jgi:hypothetical protein